MSRGLSPRALDALAAGVAWAVLLGTLTGELLERRANSKIPPVLELTPTAALLVTALLITLVGFTLVRTKDTRPAPGLRTLVFWANAEAATNTVIDSIKDKLRQVAQGSAIILLVCEDPAIDCEDFEDAIEQSKRDVADQALSVPEGLQYAVMAERFEEGGSPRIRVSRLAGGNLPDWTDDLRTLRLRDTHDLRDNPKRG